MGVIPDGVYCFDIRCNLIKDIDSIKDDCYQMYITKMTDEISSFILHYMGRFKILNEDYTGFWFRDNDGGWCNITAIKNECLKGIK